MVDLLFVRFDRLHLLLHRGEELVVLRVLLRTGPTEGLGNLRLLFLKLKQLLSAVYLRLNTFQK